MEKLYLNGLKIINKHKVHKFVVHKLVNFILFHYLCHV